MRALGVRHWDKEGFLHHSVSWRCVMMHGTSKTGLALKLAGFGNKRSTFSKVLVYRWTLSTLCQMFTCFSFLKTTNQGTTSNLLPKPYMMHTSIFLTKQSMKQSIVFWSGFTSKTRSSEAYQTFHVHMLWS